MCFVFLTRFMVLLGLCAANTWERLPIASYDWLSISIDYLGQNVIACATPEGTFLSSNYGQNWTLAFPPSGQYWFSVASDPSGAILFSVAQSGPIYKSSDGGQQWVNTGAPSKSWVQLSMDQTATNLVVASYQDGIYYSPDGGTTWILSDAPITGLANQYTSVATDATGQFGYAVNMASQVYKSVNYGQNWVLIATLSSHLMSVAVDSTGQYVTAVGTSIYRSDDFGETWVTTSAPALGYSWITNDLSGQYLVGAVGLTGTFRSTDGGQIWNQTDAPGSPTAEYWLYVASSATGQYVYGVTDEGGLWRANYSSSHAVPPTTPPTAMPSLLPTRQPSNSAAALAVFTATQALEGISLNDFNADYDTNALTLSEAIASCMVNVSADAVQDLVVRNCSVGDTVCEPQQQLSSLRSLTYSAVSPMVVADYSISTMSQYTNTQLSVQLQDATEDGTFNTNLHTLAASNLALALLNVTSGNVDMSYPSTDDDSGGNGRWSVGVWAGIVIGAALGAVLVGVVLYFAFSWWWFQRKTPMATREMQLSGAA